MDRTLIAPYKAEEKDLSEKLYKKLEGLMLIHPPNEEFKKLFTKDMFIKTNQTAFFQVFHYLFRMHDAAEFKRRFYWPITDKRGESAFRCSTVEYLKFLSEKHNLNWNVKTYLVQMPGGMKFIIFVLDLIGFIIGEQIRMREKQLGIETPAEGFSELNLIRIQKKHKFLKDYTADYINEVEQQTTNLRRTTQLIKAELCEIECGIEADIDNNFIRAFEASNEHLYETKFLKLSQDVLAFESSLMDLKVNINKYQQNAIELRKDRNNLCLAIQKVIGAQDGVKLTMNDLIAAFVQIQPIMENWLSNVVEKNSAISDDMTTELMRLQAELVQIEKQITDYQQKYKTFTHSKSKEANEKDVIVSRNLISKYVFTPPIKVTPIENHITYLPLLDDACFNNQLDLTRSAHKSKSINTSIDLSTTLNRSQLIDPAKMLRSIYKTNSKKIKASSVQNAQNLSMLGLKWKERQQLMFGVDSTEKITPIKPTNNVQRLGNAKEPKIDIRISSPKTPFNAHSNDTTRVALASFISPSLKQVDSLKEDAFNIKNMSTSPTGRLEPLCFAEDISSIHGETIDNSIKITTEDNENEQNSINVPKKLTFDVNLIANDDSIFNTSDTVLNDIL